MKTPAACPVCKQPVQDGGLNHACPKYRQPSPEPDWCPECGAPGNDRRDLSLGAEWRQCDRRECLQEWFTDIDYKHRVPPKPAQPPFTSERDKAAEAYEQVEELNADGSIGHCPDCTSKAFRAGADWGHARASEEIERLKSDTPAMCAYCSFELPKGAKLSELQKHINRCEHHPLVKEIDRLDIANTKLRNQLASSQAREEGLRRALEFYADSRQYDANEIVDGVEVLEICGDQGDTAREALAAHGGGGSDV